MDIHVVIVDFSHPLLIMDRQNINSKTYDLNSTIDKMNLTDIYKTLYPTTLEYKFLSSTHGTFSRIDYMLGHKSSIKLFKKIKIITSIFSEHNAIKLDINCKKYMEKYTNM